MEYTKGQVVRHPTLGLGKITAIARGILSIRFKADKAIREIHASFPLQVVTHTHEAAVQKFLAQFPMGFRDPKCPPAERDYKWAAHELWNSTLNRPEFENLLAAKKYDEIAYRALRVDDATNLVYPLQKAALRDAVREPEAAEGFACGLFDLIYGGEPFEARFRRFARVLNRLPQPGTRTTTWPLLTVFPFLAFPDQHLFLKPKCTQFAAKRCRFDLEYKSYLHWPTYSCLLEFAKFLMDKLADLHPLDMIDIQAFIWVTRETEEE